MSSITEIPSIDLTAIGARKPFPSYFVNKWRKDSANNSAVDGASLADETAATDEASSPRAHQPLSAETLGAAGLLYRGGLFFRRAIEEMRLVQHRVLRLLDSSNGFPGQPSTVLVAGLEKENPSIALNIAAGLARWSKRRVILIDASPTMAFTETLGSLEVMGFRSLGERANNIHDMLWPTYIPNLDIIFAGGIGEPSDGVDALSEGEEREKMINQLASAFPDRIIVIHTAPVLVYSEAATMAKSVDVVVLVVEAGKNSTSELSAAIETLGRHERIGVLVNNVSFRGRGVFARGLLRDIKKRDGAKSKARLEKQGR